MEELLKQLKKLIDPCPQTRYFNVYGNKETINVLKSAYNNRRWDELYRCEFFFYELEAYPRGRVGVKEIPYPPINMQGDYRNSLPESIPQIA